MIESTWNTALHLLETMPWALAVFLVGWVGSIGVTHPVKVGLRRFTRIDPGIRHMTAWCTAVLSAAGIAWLYGVLQVPPPASPGEIALVASLTGIWSPLAFAALQRFLRASPEIGQRKGFGWLPDLSGLADLLSGDHGPSLADREPRP